MVKSTALNDAEAIKQNLKAVEGDKLAALEGHNAKINGNQQVIAELREENKSLVNQIRQMKNRPTMKHGANLGPKAIEQLDQKVCNQIKRFNAVRATAETKEKEIANLMMQLNDVALDESYFKQNVDGKLAESIRITTLETQVEKAATKFADAKVMTNTYDKIISKLEDDRQEFDNMLMTAETTLDDLRGEKADLEQLSQSALESRDKARSELAECERQASAEREAREKTKRELQVAAEEQRLKYEAMERRLRLSSHGERKSNPGDDEAKREIAAQLETSEGMMRRIQEATGVMDVHEVLSRFRSQNETEKKLTALKEENTATLAELKEKLAVLEKKYESQKYTGEARNTSNQRMVTEFEQYLTAAEKAAQTAQVEVNRNEALLVRVRTGVDHLHDKLDTLKAVKFRTASSMMDKLTEAQLRLEALQTELEQRKSELESAKGFDAPLILPANNTRIDFRATVTEGRKVEEEEDSTESNEAITRAEVKRRAQLVADANFVVDPRKRK
eukprot:m.65778 g.65778  ORF g.65778 m.65778 type:complete len:506 (-) comp23600_c0_seq2:352-1869(-)